MHFLRSVCVTVCLFLIEIFALSAQETGWEVLAKSDTAVSSVAWSYGGKYFATSWNNSVILWDAETNTVCAVYSGHSAPVINAHFSPDDKWFLSVGEDNAVIIRNVDDQQGTRITGSASVPIRDAAFVNNGYAMLAALDGYNTAYCFRLVLTQQFLLREVAYSSSPVYGLDVNRDASLSVIATKDGTVQLVQIKDGRVVGTFPRYAESSIPPRFSPNGKAFLSAADKTSLVVQAVRGGETYFIRDSDQPVNVAIFSPDGRKIVTATRKGGIKMYDIATGKVEREWSVAVNRSDVVQSLAFSPGGDFLLAGTQQGYILRWNLTGKETSPIRRQFANKDLLALAEVYRDTTVIENADSALSDLGGANTVIKEKVPPRNEVSFEVGYTSIKSDMYLGSGFLDINYRAYPLLPLYFGISMQAGIGIPSEEFPYEYRAEKGLYKVSAPYLYTLYPHGILGLGYWWEKHDLLIFAELSLGPTIRILCNNDLEYFNTGDVYYGVCADAGLGLRWHFLRAGVGFQYDTNYDIMIRFSAGFSVKLKKRESAIKTEGQPQQ